MDDLYDMDLYNGMVSWGTMVMMTEAFSLDALRINRAYVTRGAVPFHV